MAGWILTIFIWWTLCSAIFFISDLQHLLFLQNYAAYQKLMKLIKQKRLLSIEDEGAKLLNTNAEHEICKKKYKTKTLIQYQSCQKVNLLNLNKKNKRKHVLDDLNIANFQMYQTQLKYQHFETKHKGLMYLFEQLPINFQLNREISALSDSGSSAFISDIKERLEKSDWVWGGRVQPLRNNFNQYKNAIKKTDGPWRPGGEPSIHWLQPWLSQSNRNQLEKKH